LPRIADSFAYKRRRGGKGGLVLAIILVVIVLAVLYYWAHLIGSDREPGQPKVSGEVELRPLPFPYRAAVALTLSPDRGLTLKEYVGALRQLNTVEGEEQGQGLGLEAGGAFFFYPPDKDWLAYFNPPGPDGRPLRQVFNSLIRAGLIDVLDSFGGVQDFSRDSAVWALESLAGEGLVIRTWADRFESPDNIRYGGGRGGHAGRIAHHADLTVKAGLRFFWLGRTSAILGQDVPLCWRSFASVYRSEESLSSTFCAAVAFGRHFLAVLGSGQDDPLGHNRLLAPIELRDGVKVIEFVRYLPRNGENDLASLFSPERMDLLVQRGGKMAVAVPLLPQESGKTFSDEDEQSLRRLAERFGRGEILVSTATRILTYTLSNESLVWRAEERDGEVHILIEAIDDPIKGRRVPELTELAGLTFYVPRSDKARLFLRDRELTTIRNLIDHTGRESISLPWPRLRLPRGCFETASKINPE